MPDLTAVLNKNRSLVEIDGRRVAQFDVREGPIPQIVPVLRDDGRAFASGKVVFAEMLNALRSKDAEQIVAWGNNHYDLADACITFEDLLKAQSDSHLLKGIRGVVKTSDGVYVAVNAEAVSKAVKGDMRYFRVCESETVTYGIRDNKASRQAANVVLFRYVKPIYIELTADQFASVDAQPLRRADFIHGREMEETAIVEDGKVVHPVYSALYPASLVAPLVSETFKFNGREYDYGYNMGLYLAEEPQGHAEMQAFCSSGLDVRSKLLGSCIGFDNHLVGVVQKSAEALKK